MWRTEISVVYFITEISGRLTTEISVKLTSKADETNCYLFHEHDCEQKFYRFFLNFFSQILSSILTSNHI